jgi:3-keto-disaccharide hydrolase
MYRRKMYPKVGICGGLLLVLLLMATTGGVQSPISAQGVIITPDSQSSTASTEDPAGGTGFLPGLTPIPTAQAPEGNDLNADHTAGGSEPALPGSEAMAGETGLLPGLTPPSTVQEQRGSDLNTERNSGGSEGLPLGAQDTFSAGPQSSSALGVHITEGFESGVVPPPGWTRIQTNPRQTWKIMVVGTRYAGSYSADVEYDSLLGDQNEVLLSPSFTASGAYLRFASMGSVYWCRDTYNNCDLNVWLVVGAWGGGDDILVHTADNDWTGSWAWSISNVDLTPYLPSGTAVRVAFQYVGNNGAQIALDAIDLRAFDCPMDSSFNGTAPGWVSHSGTWYIGGQYLYTNGLSGTWSSASYTEDFGNFNYEVRMWRSGCDSCANHITFRGTPYPLTAANNWYNEYKLQYARNGSYSVYKRIAGGTSTALVPWTASAAIAQGDAWNTLRVEANGTSLSFYINGTLLWSGTDSSLSTGRAGVGMYQDSSTGNELRVDWARLCTLPYNICLPLVIRH